MSGVCMIRFVRVLVYVRVCWSVHAYVWMYASLCLLGGTCPQSVILDIQNWVWLSHATASCRGVREKTCQKMLAQIFFLSRKRAEIITYLKVLY